MINLSENAIKQFKLYSFHGETIEQTFHRVAEEFTKNEKDHEIAYNLLEQNIWRPNTPVFLNAGTDHKVFSACYVTGLEDSMESIFDVADISRKIFQFGAGIGIPIGNLRESEAYIYEGNPDIPPEGRSSGPKIFMNLYDVVGYAVKSGGRVRRAAIMCNVPVWHPDIKTFIKSKIEDGYFSNMNISVNITDKFMQALKDKIPFNLHTPYDGSKTGEVDPNELWDLIADCNHSSGDPGVIFIDRMNEYNPLIAKHMIEATNPCGEQPLIPFGCCNLSAINLAKFVRPDRTFDWQGLFDTAFIIMGLMDNIIDKMEFPEECSDKNSNIKYRKKDRFRIMAEKYRPIGIGPMGLGDALYLQDIKYDSPQGREFAAEAMRIMTTACVKQSALRAKEHGTFFQYNIHKENMERIIAEHIGYDEGYENSKDVFALVKEYGVRNIQFTTCQPTGTTALSCDASYGIEPIFGLTFDKNYVTGETVTLINEIFNYKFKDEDWFKNNFIERIHKNEGSLKGIHGIPQNVRETFVVAHDIKYTDRIDMQAAIQKYCSTAISSTVNLSTDTTKEEISEIYKYAYEKGLKGITIYRDGSKKNQPITFSKENQIKMAKRPNKLPSFVHKIETGNGQMYVTVAEYQGKPLEVFVNLGKSGQILNTLTEALSRVMSIALQQGVPLEEITKTLVGINSDKPTWFRFEDSDARPTQILSIPDGLAKLLERYYSGIKTDGEISGEPCPKCGLPMKAIEGCFSCTSCGHSNCS